MTLKGLVLTELTSGNKVWVQRSDLSINGCQKTQTEPYRTASTYASCDDLRMFT